MRERFDRFRSSDVDITALRLEHFTALLETILVFALFYLIQQYFALGGFFEQALDAPGTIGTLATNMGWIVASVLGLFVIPIFIRWISKGWKPVDFGFAPRPGRRDVILAVYLGIIMGLWFSLGFWISADAFTTARSLFAINDWWDALFYMVYVALFVAALRNEFFYRGYIQKLLTSEYGTAWGTFLALLFFLVSFHWIGWIHVFSILGPIGLGSALLFNRRGAIYGPLIYHALTFLLGFLGYALLELTPGGYAIYTAILALIVAVGFWPMRMPLLLLVRDLVTLIRGLRSYWLRNGIITISMVVIIRILWETAHTNLIAHTWFTVIFTVVLVTYKLILRHFELRRILGA